MRKFINKIIDGIQRKRAIKNHRKMWHWLAENPGESKLHYLLKYGGPLLNSCYLCHYANRAAIRAGWDFADDRHMCVYCPLDWGGKACNCADSLYRQWHQENYSFVPNEKQISELALQIAELPEKVEK